MAHAALAAETTDAFGAAAAYESPDAPAVGEHGGLPCLFAGDRADVLVEGPGRLQDLVVERGGGSVVAAGSQSRHGGQQTLDLPRALAEVRLLDRVGRVDRAPGGQQRGVLGARQDRSGVGSGNGVPDRLEGDRGDLRLDVDVVDLS